MQVQSCCFSDSAVQFSETRLKPKRSALTIWFTVLRILLVPGLSVRVGSSHKLESKVPSITARTLASASSTGCLETDTKLWSATMDEDKLDSRAVVSPPFGLQQKNKLRPIDNFSASQANNATGLQDKFVVDAVDEICALIINNQSLDPAFRAWFMLDG